MPLFSHYWPDHTTGRTDLQQLQIRGPALQVEIAIADDLAAILLKANQPIPPPRLGTALIDTGASVTAVEETDLRALGLQPVGVSSPISTPDGTSRTYSLYACKLSFPGTPIPPLSFNAVAGCNLTAFDHKALIGRDILSAFLLVYNGVEGSWTLAF